MRPQCDVFKVRRLSTSVLGSPTERDPSPQGNGGTGWDPQPTIQRLGNGDFTSDGGSHRLLSNKSIWSMFLQIRCRLRLNTPYFVDNHTGELQYLSEHY